MSIKVEIPALGESISECTLGRWLKEEGEIVAADEPLCELETDKANVELPSPGAGKLKRLKQPGDVLKIGEVVAQIEAAEAGAEAPKPKAKAETPAPAPVEAKKPAPAPVAPPAPKPQSPVQMPTVQRMPDFPMVQSDVAGIRRVPMSRIRKRIASRLVAVKQETAMLTTFNEVDLSVLQDIRARNKEEFQKRHGVSLGLMSFFVRACSVALSEFPAVNASIDGDDVVYHDYVHLGVAVSTERGLVVPVLRNAHEMSFAKIELEIKRLAESARAGQLAINELSGGTFTITNGGVFGSLLSTPILSPPESAILGMHTIQRRPIAVEEEVVIRPMMYVALSYDHRIIDGRESVSFLKRVKEVLENPSRLVLDM